jgi:hypothetical protein
MQDLNPLWTNGLTKLARYQHVERLGHEDVEGLLKGEVIVQNKMDGANLTVAMIGSTLVIGSRNSAISINGEPNHGFNGAVEYILHHDQIIPYLTRLAIVLPAVALRGEWLVKHSMNYKSEAYGQFYVFDEEHYRWNEQTQKYDWSYRHPEDWQMRMKDLGIKYIPNVAVLRDPTLDQLIELSKGPDEWGAEQKEGIVIKNYAFKNTHGRTTWGKIVSADFKEKHKLAMGASKRDAPEMRFIANYLTDAEILKTIHKIADDRAESPRVQHMAELLGRTWYDIFKDNLWDFVKNERVGAFDFRSARELATRKVRETALAFYNGIPAREETLAEPSAEAVQGANGQGQGG